MKFCMGNPTQQRLFEFFKEIEDIYYVVQRNFDELPESYEVGDHKDLDIFCSDYAKAKLRMIALKYSEIPIDIFSPEDDYYPEAINEMILDARATIVSHYGDAVITVYIPNSKAHFFSLFYHNAVHKENGTYGKKLQQLFLKTFPPVECSDKGVGHFPVDPDGTD